MKKLSKFIYITATLLLFITTTPVYSFSANLKGNISSENVSFSSDSELKRFFSDYEKLTNNQDIDKLMDLYDSSYLSADKFSKEKLKDLALESWKAYPNVKYSLKVLSYNGNYENATVIVEEDIVGDSASKVEYIKGSGKIESHAITVYYLKKFYDGWKIVSDYIIDERTSLKYGIAKDLDMKVDAPTLIAPNHEYTASLQLNVPKEYIALISLNNEQITFPAEKAPEVFRTMKTSGIQERVLKSNSGSKNENAVASIGIAKADIKEKDIKISIVGIAFMTSRVNLSLPAVPGIKLK